MRFVVGVHSVTSGVPGTLIRAVTEARCSPPWLMGPAHPATHAYVGWTHGDGIWYRLDGQPGGADLALWDGPSHPRTRPSMHWELVPGQADVRAAHARAVELIGVSYDYLELGSQVIPDPPDVVERMFRKIGIDVSSIPEVDQEPFIRKALICTALVRRVLEDAGQAASAFAKALPNRFPERMGQGFRDEVAGDGKWLTPWHDD